MSPRLALSGIVLLAVLAGVYHFFFSATAQYKHHVQQAMDDFAKIVETQSPAAVHNALDGLVNDFAHINLEVHFPVPGQKQTHPPAEVFGKTEFLNFIDNIVYSVNDYHFKASVSELTLSDNHAAGDVVFTVEPRAHGVSGVMMEKSSEFTVPATCKGKVQFDTAAKPQLMELACVMTVGR